MTIRLEAEEIKFRDTASRVRCWENTANNGISNLVESVPFCKLYQNNANCTYCLSLEMASRIETDTKKKKGLLHC